MDILDKLTHFTRTREAEEAGVYPYFIPVQSETGPETVVGGRTVLMFGSNNYLGLTQHPHVKEMAIRAVEKYGSGCTGSRFLNGTLDLHEELESRLARFMGRESALVFTTGYQANLGAISALAGRHDVIVCDKADHASIVDGCKLSLAQVVRYRHNDMADLERVLSQIGARHGILIVVDGVFSMEGDLACLPEIVRLKKQYGARLLVDDAHGIGVLGPGGRGTLAHFGLDDEVDFILGTFSKSFASTGGFLAATEEVTYFVKHNARPLVFSASIPPASAAAALGALDVMEAEPDRQARLLANANRWRGTLSSLGFNTGKSQTSIVPVHVGDDMRLAFFWRALYDNGLFVNAAVAPAVEPGHALLRTSCMATHTDRHLDAALSIIERLGREFGVIQ